MTPKSLISLACGTALLAFSQPVLAKDPSPKKLLEMSAGCAYVVSIAEGSDVTLNYGSADWLGKAALGHPNLAKL
jgi:ethanolamine ammonia-lyase large subunit|tara:strand:- start:165 stop:389 length:225 start_codon:yes stop_codon:yes gene_type:complete